MELADTTDLKSVAEKRVSSSLTSGTRLELKMEWIVPHFNYPLIFITSLFMVFDIVTGFIAACRNHCVDSQKMKDGLFHKCGFLLAIAFACLCEYATMYIDLGFTIPVQWAVCIFIIGIEIVSNLENIVKISPELANKKFFAIFNKDEEDLPSVNVDAYWGD